MYILEVVGQHLADAQTSLSLFIGWINCLNLNYGTAILRYGGFKKDEMILAIPVHNNRVKSVYVRRVLELIEGEQT